MLGSKHQQIQHRGVAQIYQTETQIKIYQVHGDKYREV